MRAKNTLRSILLIENGNLEICWNIFLFKKVDGFPAQRLNRDAIDQRLVESALVIHYCSNIGTTTTSGWQAGNALDRDLIRLIAT